MSCYRLGYRPMDTVLRNCKRLKSRYPCGREGEHDTTMRNMPKSKTYNNTSHMIYRTLYHICYIMQQLFCDVVVQEKLNALHMLGYETFMLYATILSFFQMEYL